MSLTSIEFIIFLIISVLIYYIFPKKFQWIWLLIISYVYYFAYNVKCSLYMVASTIVIYFGTLWLAKVNDKGELYLKNNKSTIDKDTKKKYKLKIKKQKRWIMILILLIEFGVLAFTKYFYFIVENFTSILNTFGVNRQLTITESFIIPIGISFFTFQSVSYVLDVFMGKYGPEKNIFKVGLFVSFFPQILQGPIGRFDRLGKQLFSEHKYNLKNIQFGAQRIGWGLFKKFVLADRAAVFVMAAFDTYSDAGGAISILAVLMYSIQLYMDFSGGIDVVIGAAEMFGITMDENFRQPYFSKSIGEFWRRWHITLGTWMKDYIFYPMSLSKKMNHLGKWIKKHFGTHLGRMIPVCIANIVIFFIVGVWHGSSWRYIIYGLYNGIIIAFSNLMGPIYKRGLKLCHINPEKKWYQLFQVFRTFILVNIGWFFDCSEKGVRTAVSMMASVFTDFNAGMLSHENLANFGLLTRDYVVLFIGCVIVLAVSILKEKGIKVRESLSVKPIVIRWTVYYAVFLVTLILGYATVTGSGFLYANF